VQTDGTLAPKEAVVQAARKIVKELGKLDAEFIKEYELKKIANAASAGDGSGNIIMGSMGNGYGY